MHFLVATLLQLDMPWYKDTFTLLNTANVCMDLMLTDTGKHRQGPLCNLIVCGFLHNYFTTTALIQLVAVIIFNIIKGIQNFAN